MTTAATTPVPLCDRCCHAITTDPARDETGLGYSREPDTDRATVAVPDDVDLIFLTGRTPRRAT